MTGKGVVLLAAALAAWFFSAAVLPAQEGDIVQRLSWGHDEYVYRYEVILEEEREGGYAAILRESTEESYLFVSLLPGRYRYTVEVYNLLDKLEYTMDWVYFEALGAPRPAIGSLPEQEARKTGKVPVRPDIGVSADYAPLLCLYGSLFAPDVFESAIFPLGAGGRIYALFLKRDWGYLGAELSASWHRLEEQKDAYTVSAQLLGARFSLLYQYRLPNRIMALNLRLGAGMLLLKDFQFDYGRGGDTLDSSYLTPAAGLSFQWLVAGPFFIEAGAVFTHILSVHDASQPGGLPPVFGAGWKW
jgi:hypothetical protein